jgi:hypothetical protein
VLGLVRTHKPHGAKAMNESLNITNQMADEERRKIKWIGHMVRLGRLPEVTAQTRWVNPDGGYTTIILGQVKLNEVITEIGRDPDTKKLSVRVANGDIEDEIFKRFPDEKIAKKLFDHIFDCWKQILEERNGKDRIIFDRYGNTKLSAGSKDDPYPEF